MEMNNGMKVCVTGGSGYLGSCLIKTLLQRGFIVHATLRNLGEDSKTGVLKSLPSAETRLKLFEADIYNPEEFETAIRGCRYVFHVATPMLHAQNSKYKDTTEAAVVGARSIAECCIRSQTVKRLVYTSSVMAASPMREDGSCFKPIMDELCWSPHDNNLNISYAYSNDFMLDYVKSKTSSEREILRYNSNNGVDDEKNIGDMEVVSLACGLVGGETLLSYLPSSLPVVLSQLIGNQSAFDALRFLQELMGSIPMVHINDVCEAHIFCIEKASLKGRFLCAAETCTVEEIADCYQQIHPQFPILEEFKSGPRERSKCDLSKLRKEGFVFKYGLKEILNDSVECAKRLGFL